MTFALTKTEQKPPLSSINNREHNEIKQAEHDIMDVSTYHFSPASKKQANSVTSDISNLQVDIAISEDNHCQQNTIGLEKMDMYIPQDMEQLLSNIDLGGVGDISRQDIEDLIQALKTIESDSNQEVNPNSEPEPMFTFDRELFAEVDTNQICDENYCFTELHTKELQKELQRKQLKLERRIEFLLRRIRKIQTRAMGQHVGAEIAGLHEHVEPVLQRIRELKDSDVPVASLSVRAMYSQSTASRYKNSATRYFGSGSTEPTPTSTTPKIVLAPCLAPEVRDDLEHIAGTLHTKIGLVETQFDSDATASSSDAESCDEMQAYSNPHQNFLTISKRAMWQYANERAAVVSRWTWLQVQISNLEHRIRQYNELHRQIQGHKGTVLLEEIMPNGVTCSGLNQAGCARTRPLNGAIFRKRKLLQTIGLHTVSKKASCPSNIRCSCVPLVVPCALCTGRTDPKFPPNVSEQFIIPNRIALLDPGYHPVLSFSDDISQSIHLEAIMKLSNWQQKSLRCDTKSLKQMAKVEQAVKYGISLNNRPEKSKHRKKYNKLKNAELKNIIGQGQRSCLQGSTDMEKGS